MWIWKHHRTVWKTVIEETTAHHVSTQVCPAIHFIALSGNDEHGKWGSHFQPSLSRLPPITEPASAMEALGDMCSKWSICINCPCIAVLIIQTEFLNSEDWYSLSKGKGSHREIAIEPPFPRQKEFSEQEFLLLMWLEMPQYTGRGSLQQATGKYHLYTIVLLVLTEIPQCPWLITW